MKVAFITGGQMRFKQTWPNNFKLIEGIDSIDLYATFWFDDFLNIPSSVSPMYNDDKLNQKLLERLFIEELYPKLNFYQICLTSQPTFIDIPNIFNKRHTKYERDKQYLFNLLCQHYSLYVSYQILLQTKKSYDCIIRFRMDGTPDNEINLKPLDLKKYIYMPKNSCYSEWSKSEPFCDQFAIGSHENMHHYFSLFNNILPYLCDNEKNRESLFHNETILSFHLKNNNVNFISGDFNYFLQRNY